MGSTYCNGSGLYNVTGAVYTLVTALEPGEPAPCPFNGSVCTTEKTYLYSVGEVTGTNTTVCGVDVNAAPPTASIVAGVIFFVIWAAFGGWALYRAYYSVDTSTGEDELKDIQNSIVKSRLQLFEGDADNELTGFETSMQSFGDAQCIAAEQELKRMHLTPRKTFVQKLLYLYIITKYWVAKTGLMNLMYVYEFFILSSFFVVQNLRWNNQQISTGLTNTFQFAKISLPFKVYLFTFWGTLAVYGIILFLSLFRIRSENAVFKDMLNKLYSFFLFIVLIPAMDICLRQLDCVYNDPDHPNYVYLRADDEVECYTGTHIVYATLGSITAVALYLASLWYITKIRVNVRDFIRFNTTFEVALLMGKAILTAINVFFKNSETALPLVLGFSLIVFVALVCVNYWIQPCRGKGAKVNSIRTGSFASCVGGTICAISSYLINNVGLGTPTAIPLYVYFGSVFVIAPIGYFINMRRARKMTIPNEPFHQLLLSEDENVRNATMLAVCLSDFLDLANQNITDAHMRPISEGLRASRRLEWMNLADNRITAGGIKLLAEALKSNRSLKTLDLSNNNIFQDGVKILADTLARRNHSVEFLLLDRVGIREEGGRYLAEVLKKKIGLKELSLQHNYLNDKIIPVFQEALKTSESVQFIDLTNNKLTRNAQINWDSNGRFDLIGAIYVSDLAEKVGQAQAAIVAKDLPQHLRVRPVRPKPIRRLTENEDGTAIIHDDINVSLFSCCRKREEPLSEEASQAALLERWKSKKASKMESRWSTALSVDESQSTTDSRPTSPTSPPPKRVLKADGWIKGGGGDDEEEGDDKADKEKPAVVTRDGEPIAKRWAPNQSYAVAKCSARRCFRWRTDGVSPRTRGVPATCAGRRRPRPPRPPRRARPRRRTWPPAGIPTRRKKGPAYASDDDEEDAKDKAGLAPPPQDIKQRKKSMAERWNPNSPKTDEEIELQSPNDKSESSV